MKKKHILAATLIGAMGLVFSSCSDYLSVERYLATVKMKNAFLKAGIIPNNGWRKPISI